jgi:hypothetical protein
MGFLSCFTKLWPRKKTPVVQAVQVESPPQKSLDPISEEKTIPTESTKTDDPDTISEIKTYDTITTVDTVEAVPIPTPVAVKEKLKPASKYILGRKISPGYLMPNKYYFIKPNDTNNMSFFGKFVELDKLVKNRAIIRLSDTSDLYVFDYKDYNFFRAIPKKSG